MPKKVSIITSEQRHTTHPVSVALLFCDTGLLDRNDLARILFLGKKKKEQRKAKKVAIIKNGQRHDRVSLLLLPLSLSLSLLLRQRINPARHIFHDISPLKYRTKAKACGRIKKRAKLGRKSRPGCRVELILSMNLTASRCASYSFPPFLFRIVSFFRRCSFFFVRFLRHLLI